MPRPVNRRAEERNMARGRKRGEKARERFEQAERDRRDPDKYRGPRWGGRR